MREIPDGSFPIARRPNGVNKHAPSGVFGDPTLATRAKGEVIVRRTVERVVEEIEALAADSVRRIPPP